MDGFWHFGLSVMASRGIFDTIDIPPIYLIGTRLHACVLTLRLEPTSLRAYPHIGENIKGV
jgi:hypothetical protein